ncbi:hypothetical protein OF83DRAFT_1039925, partial [Amylostereum chailletii]
LALQMKRWTSSCYDHFSLPPTIDVKDGKVRYKFHCKVHPLTFFLRVRTDSSTSNLLSHTQSCGSETAPDLSISAFAHERLHLYTDLWVACSHRPFVIIENEYLVKILKMFNSAAVIPSDSMVSRDVKEIFTVCQANVKKFLLDLPGMHYLGLDGWSSPNAISFLGVVVYFLHDGKMKSVILDFI